MELWPMPSTTSIWKPDPKKTHILVENRSRRSHSKRVLETGRSNILGPKFYGKCIILGCMFVQNFSSIGSALLAIQTHMYSRWLKTEFFLFSGNCLQNLEDLRFSNSESAVIRQILSSITYPKIIKIWEPRLSKFGRGLHAVTHMQWRSHPCGMFSLRSYSRSVFSLSSSWSVSAREFSPIERFPLSMSCVLFGHSLSVQFGFIRCYDWFADY